MNVTSQASRTPVYGLDAVRFLAALLVVAYHLGFKAWALSGGTLNKVLGATDAHPPGWQLSWSGWIGVQVFFVVSGAVIAYSAQGVSAHRFAVRRIARLLPALVVAVMLAVPVAVLAFKADPVETASLAARTIAFVPWGPWLLGQFWTIPIELGFYALVFLLLVWGRAERGLPAAAWALGLASAAYWLAHEAGLPVPGGRLPELALLCHGGYFALGMLCARLGSGTLAPRHGVLALVCVGTAAMQVRVAAGWEMAQRPDLASGWLLPFAIWVALTFVVAASFRFRSEIAAHVKGLAPHLKLLGMSTYPLYLVHIHVGGAVLQALSPRGIAVALAGALMASLLAALCIARWIEPVLHAGLCRGLDRIGRGAAPARAGRA